MTKFIGNRIGSGVTSYTDGGIFNSFSQFYLRLFNKWPSQAYLNLISGGTLSTPGDGFAYLTYTSPGSFSVAGFDINASYLVVAGGGGGGGSISGQNWSGGGGGGGGVRTGNMTLPLSSVYLVSVGAPGPAGSPGGNSSISLQSSPSPAITIFATGGGSAGGPGGSGGGAQGGGGSPGSSVVSPDGISPTTQGYPGGSQGSWPGTQSGGGGGGAGGSGTSSPPGNSGGVSGGPALTIPAFNLTVSGGGGSGGVNAGPAGPGAGTYGYGGGGGSSYGAGPSNPGSSGGAGIVVIKYKL